MYENIIKVSSDEEFDFEIVISEGKPTGWDTMYSVSGTPPSKINFASLSESMRKVGGENITVNSDSSICMTVESLPRSSFC